MPGLAPRVVRDPKRRRRRDSHRGRARGLRPIRYRSGHRDVEPRLRYVRPLPTERRDWERPRGGGPLARSRFRHRGRVGNHGRAPAERRLLRASRGRDQHSDAIATSSKRTPPAFRRRKNHRRRPLRSSGTRVSDRRGGLEGTPRAHGRRPEHAGRLRDRGRSGLRGRVRRVAKRRADADAHAIHRRHAGAGARGAVRRRAWYTVRHRSPRPASNVAEASDGDVQKYARSAPFRTAPAAAAARDGSLAGSPISRTARLQSSPTRSR